MKTAVIYARYSSDNQTEQSIEGQLRVCNQYAENHDILIVDTYIDRAMTGTNDHRPDFQKMIKDSSRKSFDYVLVYKLDRFSRNKFEMANNKKILKDNGVKIISAMENIPDTPEGIILESLLEGMAEYYSAELAQKVKRGMRESRMKGYFQGGTLAYGYKVENKRIIIDEATSVVVKKIFTDYANGKYVSEIIGDLTSMGIYYKGKSFNATTVYLILKKEIYTGIYKKDGEIFTNMYPQIISTELFNKVQERQKNNHYGKRSIQTVYLFKNKLICGYCGRPISSDTSRTRNNTKLNYYKCLSVKKYQTHCGKETIRQEILEETLLNAIINEMQKPKTLDIIVKHLLKVQEDFTNIDSTINILQKQKKQAETKLNNMVEALAEGIRTSSTGKKLQELENTINDLEKQILIEKSKISVELTETEIRKFYTKALKEEPLVLINYLIKNIVLYNDKVEITFNSPITKSPDKQGFLILKKIIKMRKYITNNKNTTYYDFEIKFYV